MEIVIYCFIQFVLVFLTYWLPLKCGRKDIGLSASSVIAVISVINIVKGFSLHSAVLFSFAETITITFVLYWIFRFYGWNKTAIFFVLILLFTLMVFVVYIII